jgi:CheY-like chemotaxis protein
LDVCLPDIGGGEVASRLQEDPLTASIPIIFLTALFSKQEETKYGRLVGGNKTMAKPYEIPKLIAEIESSLQGAGSLY